MSTCPICAKRFDERAYQLVVPGIGAFDSVTCAEEALRRHRREARGELTDALIDAVERARAAADSVTAPDG